MLYHIWTVGCQMNAADSGQLARELESRGLAPTDQPEMASLIVLNTCSVRQAAEDKALSKAGTLRLLRARNPELMLAFGGCMVSEMTIPDLRRKMPHIEQFFAPAQFDELLRAVDSRLASASWAPGSADGCLIPREETSDDTPVSKMAKLAHPDSPSRWLPIMNGCDRRCSYCIVPFRRGPERSRPIPDLVAEANRLVGEGAKEITLLGQIVDRYGHDLPDKPDLAQLLRALSQVEGIDRIRFLTSHPRDFKISLIEAMADLPKVCRHVNIPVQAGDDTILRQMARGYSVDHYREVISQIRRYLPDVSLATDIIVGFPGETETQFENSLALLREIRFDVVHVAMYSVRPGTRSADAMVDNVSPDEKKRRLLAIEELQKEISTELNTRLLGQTVDILVEGLDEGRAGARGRWRGRTSQNKLVFFPDDGDWLGKLAWVKIDHTGPWSVSGTVSRTLVGQRTS